jgi:hypothetical protein
MDAAFEAPPVVALPERLDRRLRLGPFPSARDALKFVSYAATGALLAPFTLPYLWLPVVALGFLVSVWRPDGRAIDARTVDYLAWRARGAFGGGPVTDPTGAVEVRGGRLRIAPGRYVAVIRARGVPFAYLPPAELTRRFELFRGLLRRTGTSLSLLVGLEPIRATDVQPPRDPVGGADRQALAGYAELVDLLARRRSQRRVYVAVATSDARPAANDVDRKAKDLEAGLAELELRPCRLTGRALRDASRRFGWFHAPEGG